MTNMCTGERYIIVIISLYEVINSKSELNYGQVKVLQVKLIRLACHKVQRYRGTT